MKAIVYTSHTGHTARYAALLSKRTGLPALSLTEAKKTLHRGDEVFYLGWLMAGGVKGYRTAKKLFALRGVAAVGMTAAPNGFLWDRTQKSGGTVDAARIFYLRGGYDGEKLRGLYRMMMKTMEKSVVKNLAAKKDRTAEEDAMLSLFCHGGDYVREENLDEILGWFGRGK